MMMRWGNDLGISGRVQTFSETVGDALSEASPGTMAVRRT